MTAFAPNIRWRRSPNCTPGRRGRRPECTIIHYTAGGSASGTVEWFADKRAKVSAHFTVARSGLIYQSVLLGDTAWHAGRAEACLPGGECFSDVNSRSIGIELANRGLLKRDSSGVFLYESGRRMKKFNGSIPPEQATLRFDTGHTVTGYWEPYPSQQLDALELLLGKLHEAGYEKAIGNMLGHESVAMPFGRKTDPGPLFPWERFTRKTQRTVGEWMI